MDIKELLDDDAFDPKKLFNEKEYGTLLINRDGFTKKENSAADLIESLLDTSLARTEQEEIFSKLKATEATAVLLQAIRSAGRNSEKAKLVAAVWESGLTPANEFLYFCDLVADADFQVAMEALSVVESCEEIELEIVRTALEKAKQTKAGHPQLHTALLENLESRLP